MTAHELARALLEMPDVPVIVRTDDGTDWNVAEVSNHLNGYGVKYVMLLRGCL